MEDEVRANEARATGDDDEIFHARYAASRKRHCAPILIIITAGREVAPSFDGGWGSDGCGLAGVGGEGSIQRRDRNGRSAHLDLRTRQVLARAPAQYLVIGFFDRAGDCGPEKLALDPFLPPGGGLTAKFGVVHEQVEHALKICLVAAVEGETGALDHLLIFRNIAGQHADTSRHGIEQRQRQALNFRRKHEQSGMGEKLFEIATGDPGKETDLVGFVAAQALGVSIGVTRSSTRTSGEYQFHFSVEAFESIDQEMECTPHSSGFLRIEGDAQSHPFGAGSQFRAPYIWTFLNNLQNNSNDKIKIRPSFFRPNTEL